MLKFNQFVSSEPDSAFLLNEEKNLHMTHLEDLVLDGGVDGVRQAINFARMMRDGLAGDSKKSLNTTVKLDGAPAVYFGIDPGDGKFFVAKKGIFNKEPKVYKTPQDVDDDIPNPELNGKMKIALKNLSKLGISKGVIQGDMMFTKGDIKQKSINGEDYIVFHPNTIAYAVPAGSDLATKMMNAEIGIVVHTAYNGSSFESMSASYGVDASKFRDTPTVWIDDANFKDVSGTATMTQKETQQVTKALSNAGKLFQKIDKQLLDAVAEKPINAFINVYNNLAVREAREISNTKKHAEGFVKFIEQKYDTAIDKLKSDRGKQKKTEEKEQVMSQFFGRWGTKKLAMLFDLQNELKTAKLLIIKKLDAADSLRTFVKTADGYKVTGQEGYVAIDHLGGSAVKLVDRLEFSFNNFSPEIVKGWQK